MCTVSFVHEWAQTLPVQFWTRDTFTDYQEVIKKLDAIDKKLGEPDCGREAKDAFMKQIEERLKRLEDKLV